MAKYDVGNHNTLWNFNGRHAAKNINHTRTQYGNMTDELVGIW
jgi:hypothetical protein